MTTIGSGDLSRPDMVLSECVWQVINYFCKAVLAKEKAGSPQETPGSGVNIELPTAIGAGWGRREADQRGSTAHCVSRVPHKDVSVQ